MVWTTPVLLAAVHHCFPALIGLERHAWKSDRLKVSIPVLGMMDARTLIASTNC